MTVVGVIGRSGQLARALRTAVAGVSVRAAGRPELDLARPASIFPALAALSADVIVNAAAETAVDRAEAEPELAQRVNAAGAGAAAAAAARLGVPFIHLSSDYVFDGRQDRPYRESDAVAPLNAYGVSKRDGERAVAAAAPDHLIVRTAWVFSPYGRNFVTTMLGLARTRAEIAVVADQRGSPTFAADLARVVLALADRLVRDRDPALRGLVHAGGTGEASWAEFAAAVFSGSAARGGPAARVRPIPSADYPTPACRPAQSRLDTARLAARFGLTLPDWHSGLAACLDALAANAWEPA